MKQWNVAILGTGAIAAVMADTLNGMEEARLYAVGSRTLDRARAFAEKYGAEKACGSYEELMADPQVELVYIATPHSEHWAKRAAVYPGGQTGSVRKGLYRQCRAGPGGICRGGTPGRVHHRSHLDPVHAHAGHHPGGDEQRQHRPGADAYRQSGYSIADVPRLRDPKLAGGALLDVGVYPLNFALALFGHGYDRVKAAVPSCPPVWTPRTA